MQYDLQLCFGGGPLHACAQKSLLANLQLNLLHVQCPSQSCRTKMSGSTQPLQELLKPAGRHMIPRAAVSCLTLQPCYRQLYQKLKDTDTTHQSQSVLGNHSVPGKAAIVLRNVQHHARHSIRVEGANAGRSLPVANNGSPELCLEGPEELLSCAVKPVHQI